MIKHLKEEMVVPREYHYQRIDSVLAQLLPDYSRSQISEWIKSSAVLRNQKSCKPKDKVLEGDVLNIHVDFLTTMDADFNQSAPEDIPLSIIYEDEHVIVINKPAGLVVHPGAGNREHTLVNALLHHDANLSFLPRAGIVHRLDKDTTGLLIVAKTLVAHTSLIRQMQAREIERHYLALVQGQVISGGTIDTGFGRHTRNRLKMAVLDHGKQAITHYMVQKRYRDFSLLNVHLMTGRTHQIRVHMAHINHCIIGDPLYGGRMRIAAQPHPELNHLLQNFKRQALHAKTLSFYHPETAEQLTLAAPLPHDFEQLIQALDQYDGL